MAATSPPIVSRSGPRWLAAPAAAAIFVAGVWVAGGVVASTFRAAMALTTLWYLVAGVLCVAVVRGRRSLRVPVLGGCAMAAVATGGWLAYSTLDERVVHERLSVGLQLAGGVF